MKLRKIKKKNLIIIIAAAILLIGGIITSIILLTGKDTKENKEEEPKEEKTNEPTVQVVDLNSTSRPYAVMINNIGAARPYHTGLQDAYLVYEMVV